MTPTGQMTNIAKDRGGMERNPHTLGNHRFWNGSQRSMLKSCLKVDVQTKRMEDQVKVMVAMKTNGVGHRVPTGFIDRHLILVIEGQDTKGKVIDALTADSRLPSIVGVDLENRPGRLYAKRLIDADGQSPAPFWRPGVSILEDTRLKPGQSDTVHATFPQEVKQVRVRVIHRRFWQHITKAKHWPTTDLIVVDRTVK